AASPAELSAASWAKLVALAALSAVWSLFLWMELVLLRVSGRSFCATGGKFDCSSIWNGSFARAVHDSTGLPIAGWGFAWSAVAFVLALAGLLRAARGRRDPVILSAVRLTAAAGVLVVAVMIVESVNAGAFCVGCLGTYLIVLAYAAVALWRWKPMGLPEAGRGAMLAGGLTVAAFVLLL